MRTVLIGAALGLAFCAPPGAVTAAAVRYGMERGFRAILAFELGSCVGDAVWGILALASLSFFATNAAVRIALGVVGVLLLCWLAYGSLRIAWRGAIAGASSGAEARLATRRSFAAGVGLALANPFAVVFWLSIGGAMAAAGLDATARPALILFFAAFVGGTVVYAVGFSALVGWGRRFVGPRLFRAIAALSGLALAGFALYLAIRTVDIARAVLP